MQVVFAFGTFRPIVLKNVTASVYSETRRFSSQFNSFPIISITLGKDWMQEKNIYKNIHSKQDHDVKMPISYGERLRRLHLQRIHDEHRTEPQPR